MKGLVGLLGLVAAAFYGAWPAYNGFLIKSALESGDAPVLERKIDFPSVRASLRPAVSKKIEATLQETLSKAGPGGTVLLDKMKAETLPKLVDGALAQIVTPEGLIRIVREGKSLKEVVAGAAASSTELRSILDGVLGGLAGGAGGTGGTGSTLDKLKDIASKSGFDLDKTLGGLLGKPEPAPAAPSTPTPSVAPAATAASEPPAAKKTPLGLGNVKSVAFNGPLEVSIGLAKDAAAAGPDVTATLGFVNGDWKVTGLVPTM